MPESVTVTEVARRLGVSRSKIWSLLRDGELEAHRNPLDKRQKLIPLSAIRRLQARSRFQAADDRPTSRLLSAGAGSNPGIASDDTEDYFRDHWHPISAC